ncbi:GtrA family protein [Terrisporobacter sp.]|uniref:GtrA family protein n=1 Tax=Terrisporobacter sp. TaxID=1965305 RepID=UPI0026028F50|nr:GtrA family protein [Terrisporobacter sp.]
MDKSLFNIKSAKIKEFLRYTVVGCINTLIYYISYLVFMNIFNFSYKISFAAGYVISIIFSYFLNTYFTYKEKPSLKKFLIFPLTYIPNFIIQYIGMILLVDHFNMNRKLAPIITAIVSTPITFFVMRYVIKKKK